MSTRRRSARVLATLALLFVSSLATPASAQDRLCDPAERDESGRDCRDILIHHIRQEKVRLDVAFWFMEDAWVASEVIARAKANVPVRILMDTEANVSTPRNATRLAEFQAAGIPMRERIANGILHWKMMLFEGQGLVQFSGANYSSDAWTVSGAEYTNYTDEAILFTTKPSIVDSFRTKFDDLWTNTQQYRDYANLTAPPVRAYDTYPIDPELNFVPSEPHAGRAIAEYAKENTRIDVTMYRITDSRYSDAMIAARQRGIPVRLITEPQQYRDPLRQYHSWNIDRMYVAGVEIRNRAHQGLNHQKSVLLYDRGLSILGSSNWSSASSDYQEEHNLLTADAWIFQWLSDQFERKWNNSTGLVETAPFTPQAPDKPTAPSPASQATGLSNEGVTLRWNGGLWAHSYDVLLGTVSSDLQLVASAIPRATSGQDLNSLTLSTALQPGTTYYWQVLARTVAGKGAKSSIWSFTTAAPAPPAATPVLLRQPYLQQVTATSAIVVWTTATPGTARLRFGQPGQSTSAVAATSTLYPSASTGMASDYYQHVVQLTGLAPSTVYAYDILLSGVDLNPQVDTFTTAPAPGTGTVSFIAIGDSGTGSPAQSQIAARLDSETFDFAMHGGDIAYGNSGGTGGATHQTMNDWFFGMYQNWLRARPIFPSIGNHDSRASNQDGIPYRDVFVLPDAGGSGAFADHAERYYSFDYGAVHVVVLDTELAFQGPDLARRQAQLAWLEADLAGTTQPWKVALFHRSPYSAGGEHGSDLEVRAAFGAVFDQHDVQLVISAHEHTYERSLPMRLDGPSAQGTTYVVTGGGGGPLYPSAADTWTAYSASVYHYVKGTATECTLRIDAIGLDGVAFDGVTLRRCDAGPDTQDPVATVVAPGEGATVAGDVTITVAATDNVAVAAVELLVDGDVIATDASAPFTFVWQTAGLANGAHVLRARATDEAGNTALSDARTVAVNNPVVGAGDIVLYAGDATVINGNWVVEADPTAAGGRKMRNPDQGAAKRTTALAAPTDYFEMTLDAPANVPYRLWIRGRADGDAYQNDSAFVQFSEVPEFAIGTARATEFSLEECSSCRVSAWGWQDNGWGAGVLGPTITFATSGRHTIRVQAREDGLSIDQIILSPSTFITGAPGPQKNDTTIYPRQAGSSSPPDPDPTSSNSPPSVSLTAPSAGASFIAPATVSIAATAADSDGAIVKVDFYAGTTLVGSSASAPYSTTWSGMAPGSYDLTARATDNGGAATVSAPVRVTVTAPPSAALPDGWSSQDVGAVGPAGTASASAGVFTVKGGGADIWGTADAFHYAWTRVSGDVDVISRVTSIEYVHAWVKAGVMIRERLSADSPQALMLVSPGKGLAFQRRVAAGGLSTSNSGIPGAAPAWVKLSRRGDTITASYSANGSSWTVVNSDSFTMPSDVYVGLVVSSHDATRLATATFDNVSISGVTANDPPPPPPPAPTLEAPWTSQDIGPVGVAGSAISSAGTFTVRGAGADIWGTADAFNFVWQPVSGDVDVIARVSSIEYVHAWVKAGVMIREQLTATSPQALMLVSPGKGLAFQRRIATAGLSTGTSGGAGTAPAWVKLERRANTITAYRSADGVTWTLVGSDTFTMANDVYVGLAVSSHTTAQAATAMFSDVSVVRR